MIISLVLSVNCGSFEQSILNCCVPGTWTISPCLADMLMSLRHSLFPSACLTSGSLCDLYWIYVETSKATSVVLDFLSFSCSFMWIFFLVPSSFFYLIHNIMSTSTEFQTFWNSLSCLQWLWLIPNLSNSSSLPLWGATPSFTWLSSSLSHLPLKDT